MFHLHSNSLCVRKCTFLSIWLSVLQQWKQMTQILINALKHMTYFLFQFCPPKTSEEKQEISDVTQTKLS